MRKQKLFTSTLAGLMIVSQLGWVGAAAAAKNNNQQTPAASESPAPAASASPAASVSPTPEPSSSPAPSASASPSPAAEASPSPTPEPKKKSTDVGPDGCGGTIPKWVFDTTTRTWVAADKDSFSCDKASGYYLSPMYYFDKRIGWYEIIPATAVAAQPEYMITAPNVVHTVLGDLKVGSADYQMAQALGLLAPTGGLVVSGTGAGSNNEATVNSSDKTWFDFTNLVNVINTLQSNANSGTVTATSNTKVGDSISGAAGVIANLINLLASAWSWSNGNLNFFMQNLTGNQNGDLMLNPTESVTGGGGGIGGANVSNTGADSNNVASGTNTSTLDVNAKNTGNIVNNVDVTAQSGDASASKNTAAGNVASGSATAQVNIINLINSMISSGSSFFGILNIFGNLNGDILFPNGFLNGLVPSGASTGSTAAGIGTTGAGSNNQLAAGTTSDSTITNTSNNAVNNNISTSAQSGAANLNANTVAGNASTGSASTEQGLFNLANTSIFGDNAVLVIVNVLGHWVGKIMTLPGTGTSQSALLTGNASVGTNNTGADSNNQASVHNSDTANINQSSAGTITNNVNVHAQSGDATADKNTKVGDVSTGDAKATSSVANIFNTVLNVKHWFGVLVINVFGDWTGDVNHDTDAGNVATEGAATKSVAKLPSDVASMGLLGVVSPIVNSTGNAGTYTSDNADSAKTNLETKDGKVLTAAANTSATQTAAAATEKNMSLMFIISALVMLIAGALLSIEKKLRRN